ncbi:uncharacterized protein LOC142342455 [Convolutriloba macropyga]|uniref:uncharacterized protein LOC142342455 n=1 Tax=Convolutriloba macropyga TaxID=536237 RepID=UPI003F520B26
MFTSVSGVKLFLFTIYILTVLATVTPRNILLSAYSTNKINPYPFLKRSNCQLGVCVMNTAMSQTLRNQNMRNQMSSFYGSSQGPGKRRRRRNTMAPLRIQAAFIEA